MLLLWAGLIWLAGLLTLVPSATWYLLLHAPRDQYALLVTLILFWIFGYWGLAGPIVAAVKIRRVMRSLEQARSHDELRVCLTGPDAQFAAIELIASENHIPRFLAGRILRFAAARLGRSSETSRELDTAILHGG